MGIYLNCKNTGQNSKYANHIDIYNNRNGLIVSIILNTLYTILSKIESKIFYNIGIPCIIKSPPAGFFLIRTVTAILLWQQELIQYTIDFISFPVLQ